MVILGHTDVRFGVLYFSLHRRCRDREFYGWLPLYLPELFPTRLRATAQGFAFNAGRLVTASVILNFGMKPVWFGNLAQTCAIISLIYIVGLVVI